MQITMEVSEWRDEYIAYMEGVDAKEATFWRNELADPWAAEYWCEFDQQQKVA